MKSVHTETVFHPCCLWVYWLNAIVSRKYNINLQITASFMMRSDCIWLKCFCSDLTAVVQNIIHMTWNSDFFYVTYIPIPLLCFGHLKLKTSCKPWFGTVLWWLMIFLIKMAHLPFSNCALIYMFFSSSSYAQFCFQNSS